MEITQEPPATEPDAESLENLALATGEHAEPDAYPRLGNISAGWDFRFMPHPVVPLPAEFAYVPMSPDSDDETAAHLLVAVARWNLAWEAAQLRSQIFDDLPEVLRRAVEGTEANISFVPETRHRYHAYQPLYHQLPRRTLERNGLPLLFGEWPHVADLGDLDAVLPPDFLTRFERAFAEHIWRRIDSGSPLTAFAPDEPLKLLAHNLDFWLPHAVAIAEEQLRDFERVKPEDEAQARLLEERRRDAPEGVLYDRPRMGGDLWGGEAWAAEITDRMVERADAHGRLRGIIDAVRSNRVQDDFSSRWSYAREDFERKLYHKRAKVAVRFVELTDTIAVHGPETEVEDGLVFEDFLALLDTKERQVVVLLRSGVTGVGDIAKRLGYANHSPVSKKLARIRRKAEAYFREL